ncbi:unnamed protein product [Clavelina lepadiformis]|uniref:Fucosyltransferase n=1 Tax=Clavelina lepadiformis TaxID=159417 RepID=A0ABP0FQZ1_CLALP
MANASNSLKMAEIMKVVIFLAIFGIALSENRIDGSSRNGDVDKEIQITNARNRYYILFWENLFQNQSDRIIPDGSIIDNTCEVSYNARVLPNALAILFHHSSFDSTDIAQIPMYRDPEQIYVWFTMHSPSYMLHIDDNDLKQFPSNFFNWTMSYRREADIHLPINDEGTSVIHRHAKFFAKNSRKLEAIIRLKRNNKLALWHKNDCMKPGISFAPKRDKLVSELMMAGLTVDRVGSCFGNSFNRDSPTLTDVLFGYKFYLALEDSYHCRDYITAEYWSKSLNTFTIPVIWGPAKEDLEALVPKGSYIYADDFSSSAALVEYLHYLDGNDTAYIEYFQWIRDPELIPAYLKQQTDSGLMASMKELCRKARANTEIKVIDDIAEYWFGTEREECLLSEGSQAATHYIKKQRKIEL